MINLYIFDVFLKFYVSSLCQHPNIHKNKCYIIYSWWNIAASHIEILDLLRPAPISVSEDGPHVYFLKPLHIGWIYIMLFEFIFVGCFHFLYRSIYLLYLLVTWLTSLRSSFWLLYNRTSTNYEMVICPYFFISLCRHVRTFMHVSGLGNFQMGIPLLLCTLMQLTKKIWMRSRKSRGLVAK